ncbi:hypothetical protein R3P38DRAFT_2759723 [Favolaschia claudopus]|uniref:Uncharacterized protein n=1 Tax=Favolaschia claudopus TaxID=2862362 RepID=A0AAW0DYU6_9AGAR
MAVTVEKKKYVGDMKSAPWTVVADMVVELWIMGGDMKSNLPGRSGLDVPLALILEVITESGPCRLSDNELEGESREGRRRSPSKKKRESEAVTVVTRRCPPEIELGIPSALERATNAWRTAGHRKKKKYSHQSALQQSKQREDTGYFHCATSTAESPRATPSHRLTNPAAVVNPCNKDQLRYPSCAARLAESYE